MTALSIQPTFPIFTDIDGQPLEDGYVFIGTANLQPIGNPITVYWDAALTLPAAQPIRTRGGYPINSGTPARLYVNSDYSIQVQNKNGSVVYSAPAATERYGNIISSADVTFIQAGTGAVTRTAQAKMREIVSVDDFGAVGDGVTNDTTALTNFFNSAISRPGVEHRLFAKTYAVASVMPTINVSDVWITGEGAEIHDVGSALVTGTVLKWIGSAGTTGPLIRITSVSGASNQRVSRVQFKGIGIDCNSGAINYGIEIASVWECDIDVCIANAGNTGFSATVVAALGEAKDTQRNRIRLKSRQLEAASGLCFAAGGDAAANFSKNEVWIDAQHKNVPAVYLVNTDNNDWNFVRTYKVPSGSATEAISCLGGANASERVRAERFWHLSANLPLRAYGTGTYAVAAQTINIYNLDVENGSPNPIVDAGATVFWKKDVTALPDTPWQTYTPTLSAASGSLTTATAAGQYRRRGNIVYLKVQINITTNGTAAGALGFSLPIATTGTYGNTLNGKERAITGKSVAGYVDGGGATVCFLQFYDGTYPGANGSVINVSGFYEVT
jgi:hypothetical protein